MRYEKVYLGHDNSIILILKADEVAADLRGITKMTLTFGATLIESENLDADPIKWARADYETGETRLYLGDEDIDSGAYQSALIVYDAANPEGIVWGFIPISVMAEVEAAPPAP